MHLPSWLVWLIALTIGALPLAPCAQAQSQCTPPPGTQWPPDNGCVKGTEIETMLPAGMEIDRYGLPSGSYFAPTRTPIPARAMACDPTALHLPHTCYVIGKPLTFEGCETAAWFGEPGGGTQYRAPQSATDLQQAGLITLVVCGQGLSHPAQPPAAHRRPHPRLINSARPAARSR